MIGSSKILTVSYGTFSCTLEGFDDSFSTMKAIAEYFRDLASEDRYFGAEPPVPDAEMLTKIAEREVSRRVEAHSDETGITLRASAPEVAAPIAAAAVDVVAPVVEAPVAMPPQATPPKAQEAAPTAVLDEAPLALTTADVIADEASTTIPSGLTFDDMTPTDVVAPTDVLAQKADTEIPAHPDSESVAAKLQRIRAVVGKAAPVAEDAPQTVAPLIQPEVADAPVDQMPEIAETIFAEEVELQEQPQDETLAATDHVLQDDETTDDQAADTEEQLAAISQRLATAVEAPADKPVVRARIVRLRKDRPAEVVMADPAATAVVAEAAETVVAPVEVTAEAPIMDAQTAIDSDMAALMAQADEAEGIVTDAPEVDELEDIAQDSLSDDAEAELMADLAAVEEEFSDVEVPNLNVETEVVAEAAAEELDEDDFSDVFGDEDLAEVAEDGEFEDVADAVSDDVLVDTPDVDDFAEVAEDNGFEDVIEPATTSVQDNIAAAMGTQTLEEQPAFERPEVTSRSVLPEADDAEMSRIMDQADEALNEPEGSRRRNAIAQLKAAVAATEAARQLGDKADGEGEAQSPFREDLDQVVRPRRPVSQAIDPKSDRARPAPLKLVASQRVDEEGYDDDVQPRRVATTAPEVGNAASFADFADQMGAKELPDLLEAAAAYTAFVEGVEDFSRPQIMKKVQLTTAQEFSREDGLRSFGALLRQGRISKVRNGRFQVSEQTRFRPDARSA